MRSRFPKLLVTALAASVWLLAGTAIADDEVKEEAKPERARKAAPPPIVACQGLEAGAACSFTGHGEKERTGVCKKRRDALVCAGKGKRRNPHAAHPGGKPGPKPKGKPAPEPAEEPSAE